MSDVENILNDDEFFGDTVDTPKEGVEQHRKQECLKSAIESGKVFLLGRKWKREKLDKASNETINKTYAEYKQRELNKKGESLPCGNLCAVTSVYNLTFTRPKGLNKMSDFLKNVFWYDPNIILLRPLS